MPKALRADTECKIRIINDSSDKGFINICNKLSQSLKRCSVKGLEWRQGLELCTSLAISTVEEIWSKELRNAILGTGGKDKTKTPHPKEVIKLVDELWLELKELLIGFTVLECTGNDGDLALREAFREDVLLKWDAIKSVVLKSWMKLTTHGLDMRGAALDEAITKIETVLTSGWAELNSVVVDKEYHFRASSARELANRKLAGKKARHKALAYRAAFRAALHHACAPRGDLGFS